MNANNVNGTTISETATYEEWAVYWWTVFAQPRIAKSTAEFYMYLIKMLKRHCPSLMAKPIGEITGIDLQCALNYCAEMGYSKSTLHAMRVVFSQTFCRAMFLQLVKMNPAYGLLLPKAPEKTVSAFTREQEKRIIKAALGDRLGLVAIFFDQVGIRSQEGCNLVWSDYDSKQHTIKICQSKTKAGIRIIPLTRTAEWIIGLQHRSSKDNFIFHGLKGNPLSTSALCRMCQRLSAAAEVPNITMHRFRHTFATRIVENGGDYKKLSQIMGHENFSFTLNRYVNVDVNELRETVKLRENDNIDFGLSANLMPPSVNQTLPLRRFKFKRMNVHP